MASTTWQVYSFKTQKPIGWSNYHLATTWSSIQITRGVVSRLTRRRASQLTHTKSIEELKTAATRIVQKGSDYPESVNMCMYIFGLQS